MPSWYLACGHVMSILQDLSLSFLPPNSLNFLPSADTFYHDVEENEIALTWFIFNKITFAFTYVFSQLLIYSLMSFFIIIWSVTAPGIETKPTSSYLHFFSQPFKGISLFQPDRTFYIFPKFWDDKVSSLSVTADFYQAWIIWKHHTSIILFLLRSF